MEQLARIVLLLVVVALVIAVMTRGPGGARDWLRAKFLGRSAQPAAAGGRR